MGKRYRFGLKTATKKEERRILQVAEEIRKDPASLLPRCDAACARILRREERAMVRIAARADNERALERASKRGPPLARAYAATLLLGHQGKATHLGVLRVGRKQVSYAKRGTASPDKLVAIQHHDDPWVRIIGYLDIVKRYGVHVYSSPSGFSCSMSADAPDWYVSDVLERSSLKGKSSCPHSDGPGPLLRIEWRSAGCSLALCRRCDPDGNLFHQVARGMGAREPERDLEVSISFTVEGDCLDVPATPAGDIKAYVSGEISNGQFIDRYYAHLQEAARSQRAIVIDGRCMSRSEAISKLATAEHERLALSTVFERVGHLGTGVTAAQVVQDNWQSLGGAMMERVAPGADIGARLADDRLPMQVLAEAAAERERRKRAEAIPRIAGLPPVGAVANELALAYRVRGGDAARQAMTAMLKEKSLPMKTRALLLAVQRSLGLRVDAWMFGADAGEYADYLEPMARELLTGPEESYRSAMAALLAALGEEFDD